MPPISNSGEAGHRATIIFKSHVIKPNNLLLNNFISLPIMSEGLFTSQANQFMNVENTT